MIIKFHKYNESLLSKMSPKSDEEINKILDDLEPTSMLYQACKYGLLNYVKKAIEKGADTYDTFYYEDPSEDVYENYSALDIAMENRHDDIVVYLLNNGHRSKNNTELKEYINHIIKNDNTKMVKILADKIDNNYKDLLVKAAISFGKNKLVKYFIDECGFDVNYGNGVYLSEACFNRNVDIINYLFEKNIINNWGVTCLKFAIKKNYNDVIESLLKNKVKPDSDALEIAKQKDLKLYFKLLKNKFFK